MQREILDYELEGIAGDFTAEERLKMARILTRWATQLRLSAQLMRKVSALYRPPVLLPQPPRDALSN
jgi:hypothetical protein